LKTPHQFHHRQLLIRISYIRNYQFFLLSLHYNKDKSLCTTYII
jgi:hypothetical protein